ncbi:MAG: TnpV protein [Clostridia bacterium]|nr:TnpV protein [Clostridia bacterium]
MVDNIEKVTLSKYDRARLRYLKEYNKGLYTELVMTGKLTEHLKEIDLNSEQKVHSIIQDMAKKDGIPVYFDDTKIEQLEWVKCMNNYKNIAEEIVNNELIFC